MGIKLNDLYRTFMFILLHYQARVLTILTGLFEYILFVIKCLVLVDGQFVD